MSGTVKRPELAAALLPVILSAEKDGSNGRVHGYDPYKRETVIQSLAGDLSAEQRLELLRNPDYGHRTQRAFLEGNTLTDDELKACLPEITKPQRPSSIDTVPDLVRYIQRFSRLPKLAEARLAKAAEQLVRDGWSPNQAAQSGQWDSLLTMADIARDPDTISALLSAALADRVRFQGPWRDARRYKLLEQLLQKPAIGDSEIRGALDKLTTMEITDLSKSAGPDTTLGRLCAEALEALHVPRFDQPVKLPSDEELARSGDPKAMLLTLIKDRSVNRDRAIAHALESVYMTDDIAWRLPIQTLETHQVYGPKLAAQVVRLCGDSAERWKVFSDSWGRQTTLTAASLFKRLKQAPEQHGV